MKRLALPLFLLIYSSALQASDCPAPGAPLELSGTIGKDLDISMTLTFAKSLVSGTYIYMKQEKLNVLKDSDSGVYRLDLQQAKSIRLNGSCTGGSLTLQESGPSGKPTGSFHGNFPTPQTAEGTWSTPDGKKTLPIHLQLLSPTDHLSGKYRTDDSLQELDIRLHDGQVDVTGAAYWMNSITGSVHEGLINGPAKLEGDTVHYSETDIDCRFTIRFADRKLTVSDSTSGCGGANVTFDGAYERVGPPTGKTSEVHSDY